MPTNKQRREAARRKLERQLAARVARERRRRQVMAVLTGAGVVVVIVAVVGFIVATNHDDKKKNATNNSSSSSSQRAALPSRKIAAIKSRKPKSTTGPCKYAETKTSLTSGRSYDVGLPPDPNPTPTKTYTVQVVTSLGTITMQLDGAAAPCNVQSIVYLISKKFYDKTACHRLTTASIFVLQCGDPSATGAAGPTYTTKDENLSKAKYTTGAIAMANSGTNTNSSQFFFIYKNSTTLPKKYTVIGKVTAGMAVIQKVAAKASDNANGEGDGRPNLDIVFKTVRVVKSKA